MGRKNKTKLCVGKRSPQVVLLKSVKVKHSTLKLNQDKGGEKTIASGSKASKKAADAEEKGTFTRFIPRKGKKKEQESRISIKKK